ncbi:STAS domain-containing protein [uncultured Jatrophihabitans sp.]|uniref:STAS domain-containing protein n=1 Tax=uncultured Jatrophihabitans sp. TaxID=1610747 RepID=UPI0035CC42AB
MTSAHDDQSEAQRARDFGDLVNRRGPEILQAWVRLQTEGGGARGATGDTNQVTTQSKAILQALARAVTSSGRIYDPVGRDFEQVRELVAESSRRGAREGATPGETAHGVLALREALLQVMQTEYTDPIALNGAAVVSGRLVDALALMTFETFVQGREELINRQNQQLIELSTPVVRVWDGIVAVPLIGTLDSVRAQVVMETLLQSIVEEHAEIAILDITGVPTVDTLVAQHLLKTVTATRLMGADCIISGIRPQTAQTIVALGIDLSEIPTRATLADALATAIRRVTAQTSGS